ncbi:MAG: hypothetical protein LBL67_03205 [Coriobacteriales bacterium]|nr:hypothetical protein [Coriobacteriales bacterium]
MLYLAVAEMLLAFGQDLKNPDLCEAVAAAIRQALDVCKDAAPLNEACTYYKRLAEPAFADASEDSIGSGGYVVDTTAAVAGGLAALRYGFAPNRGIPAAW